MTFFDLFRGYFSQRKRAMTIYRRGLARANEHDGKGALADYSAVSNRLDFEFVERLTVESGVAAIPSRGSTA